MEVTILRWFLLLTYLQKASASLRDSDCVDHPYCASYLDETCSDQWLVSNCQKKCGICAANTAGISPTTGPTVNPLIDDLSNVPTSAPDRATVVPQDNYRPTAATGVYNPSYPPAQATTPGYNPSYPPAQATTPGYNKASYPPAQATTPGYNQASYPPSQATTPGHNQASYPPSQATLGHNQASYPPSQATLGHNQASYPPSKATTPGYNQASYPPAQATTPGYNQASYPPAQATGTNANVYNQAAQPSENAGLVTGTHNSLAPGTGVYVTSAPQGLPAEGVDMGLAPQVEGAALGKGTYLVELPPPEPTMEKVGEETIKIYLGAGDNTSTDGSKVVSVKPVVEEGKEKIKVSFIESAPSVPGKGVQEITLEPPTEKGIRISFGDKEPTGVSLSTNPHGENQVKNIKILFAKPTGSPATAATNQAPSGHGAAGEGWDNENITVNFLNNVEIHGLSPSELREAVTVQKQPTGMHGKHMQEPWCTDSPLCSKYNDDGCRQDWVQVNCPRKCKFCGAGKFAEKPYTQLNVTVPQEMTSQLKKSKKPVMVKIETEGSLAEAAREGKGNSPVVESIVLKLPSKFKAEEKEKIEESKLTFSDESNKTAPAFTIEIPETAWCRDDPNCNRYINIQCNDGWVEVNCPMKCGFCRPICKDSSECSRYTVDNCKENNWMRQNCKKKCSLCEGQSKPEATQGPCAFDDHVSCTNYTDCNSDWMIENCKKKCGNCTAETSPTSTPSPTLPPSTPSTQANESTVLSELNHAQCFYDGAKHEHGERWSPSPCTPECKCDDGKIHCTVIECPDLKCKSPIKKQWKCCPECPKEEGINSRCVETEGGNGNNSCCVFPFTYHGAQYTKCLDNESKKPWCATSSNFDIDGQWGSCVGPPNTISSAVEHAPSGLKEADFVSDAISKSHSRPGILTAADSGAYSKWSKWSKCSSSCGGGTQERARNCTSLGRVLGGVDCSSLGPALETRECNLLSCPVNGGFTVWSNWSSCDISCGGGLQQRYRTCTNPSPSNGGRGCIKNHQGPSIESKSCNEHPCPIDGSYTDWTGWSDCGKSCGLGKKVRRRHCANPPAAYGGRDCKIYGDDNDVAFCNNVACEVDGKYSNWSEWTSCSRSCGPGVTSRHRTCSNPVPSELGADCSNRGPAFEQQPCFMKTCPAEGNWKLWSEWSRCTLPCGGGIQFRKRVCVGLKHDYCLGERVQSRLCDSQHCPVDGNYTDWTNWTSCSTTCGVGIKMRNRTCTNPTPQFDGKSCEDQELGLAKEAAHCYMRKCAVDGQYSNWLPWQACSQTCGPGYKVRSRSCTKPPPANGGHDCSLLGRAVQSSQCYDADCPVNGNFTLWSNWSSCSVTCGEGTTTRTRSCTDPTPAYGGTDCSALGSSNQVQPCKMRDCVVDGGFSAWSSWSVCSKTCGRGVRRRLRSCINPIPAGGGKSCTAQKLGPSLEFDHCFDRTCPLDGSYNRWSAWTTCSVSCGSGVKYRHRNCTNPEPMHGGRDCSLIGSATESNSCHNEPCPVNGNYGTWSLWSECDKTCGIGKRLRFRSCASPSPQFGGSDCSKLGPDNDAEVCNQIACPTHGNYSEWSIWSPCSVTCGQGVVARKRFCTNPPPSYGGLDCEGLGVSKEKKSCQLMACKANCTCGAWGSWLDCSTTCGGGVQTRTRACFAPGYEKVSCDNDKQESRLCRTESCPINGKFDGWSPWSPCSVTCGVGMKNRTRSCVAPKPQFGGKTCAEQTLGPGHQNTKCYLVPCPVNGGYTEWSDWEKCSVTCGQGVKARRRSCTNPEPAYGGVACHALGAADEAVQCYDANCPIEGRFTSWSGWSACSKSCDYGIQTRKRTCTSPQPQHGGRDCTDQGDPEHVRTCQVVACPIHGNYSLWSKWGSCSTTCGFGVKKRTRTCTSPPSEYGGLKCNEKRLGRNVEAAKCFVQDCPVNGRWSPWSTYTGCSTTCGPGVKSRKRTCNNPPPQNGGTVCSGAETEAADCSYRTCPVHGNYTLWSDWSACDKSCGLGLKTRYRACSNPEPQNGGRDCYWLGSDTESKFCNETTCTNDGNWGQWSSWSGCTKSCGSSVRTRERICNNPVPSGHGKYCTGSKREFQACKDRDCCDVPFRYVGCYRDNQVGTRPLPELLLTDNNPTSLVYSGVKVDLKNWAQYIPELICRCAKTANIKGYTHFSIQNLGECWSGPKANQTYLKDGIQPLFNQKPSPKPWVGCLDSAFKECHPGSDACVGQDKSNSVFTFTGIVPIDGDYGPWSAWTPCSQSCGLGTLSRTRNCTSPAPQFGGKDCLSLGASEQTQPCKSRVSCPVNGAFTTWGNWSTCSASCGMGFRTRERSCTNPSPSLGGESCQGPSNIKLPCMVQDCPASCGMVFRTRERSCTNPSPSLGGESCQGPSNIKLPCMVQDCPVNGSWSAWNAWQACSTTCGDGVQIRVRFCSNPRPSENGFPCIGDAAEEKACAVKRCPVDGNYTDWSDWSGCSRSCGGGVKARRRDCTNPSPQYGGKNCSDFGADMEKVHCNVLHCPVQGNWADWNMWSFCSAKCGPGKRERMRKCSNPAPKYGGGTCAGSDRQIMPCSLSDCPVNGRWGKWSLWTECSATCGAAKRSRSRNCDNPPPAHSGRSCTGPEKQEEYCKVPKCQVNGDYSDWGSWTQCDVTCGGGHRLRSRACTNPVAQYGGLTCALRGNDKEMDICNTRSCAQPGGWSGWSVWSSCSRSCGSGVNTRIRTCTAPLPAFGGEECVGQGTEIKACKLRDCCNIQYKPLGCYRDDHNMYRPLPEQLFGDEEKVDMKDWPNYQSDVICRCARETQKRGWTTFGVQNFSECLSGERAGDSYRMEGEQLLFMTTPQAKPWLGCVDNEMRPCTGQHNLECSGQERTNYVFSLENVRPVQGNYTDWSGWTECSSTCGQGEKYRTRNCTNPPPAFGGMDCSFVGADSEVQQCENEACAVDGNWASWGNWSDCSVTCGRGTVRRSRACNSPTPSTYGKPCAGEATEQVNCHVTTCPVDGRWSAWNPWGACSVSCGNGRQIRARQCSSPEPSYGGKFCDGPEKEDQNCEEDDCPGYWSEWTAWSSCSHTCGSGGKRHRTHTCQAGAVCQGSAQDVELCEVQQCPVCSKSLDLAFLLDASGSMDDSQWKLTKDFVQGVTDAFTLLPNSTRVAVITYSTQPHMEIEYGDIKGQDHLTDYMASMSQPRGSTRTDRALQMAREQLIRNEGGTRDDTPKAVIVITAGETTPVAAKAAEQRARELKDTDGATIVALGVGSSVDQYGLQQLASNPDHAFLVSSFDEIIGFVKPAADAACAAKPPPPPPRWGPWSDWSPCMKTCGQGISVRSRACLTGNNCRGTKTLEKPCKIQDCPACNLASDLAFVLPVSSKIKDTEWKDVQNFVKGVTNSFNVSYTGTHVGILSYSSQATLEMMFGRYYYPHDIVNVIENLYPEAQSSPGTRLDDAMDIAHYELFTSTGGSRDQFPKILVVLTSGKLGYQKLDDVTGRLRDSAVTTVAVDVGPRTEHDELAMIADFNHTFHADSFDDLIAVVEKVVNSVCAVPKQLLTAWALKQPTMTAGLQQQQQQQGVSTTTPTKENTPSQITSQASLTKQSYTKVKTQTASPQTPGYAPNPVQQQTNKSALSHAYASQPNAVPQAAQPVQPATAPPQVVQMNSRPMLSTVLKAQVYPNVTAPTIPQAVGAATSNSAPVLPQIPVSVQPQSPGSRPQTPANSNVRLQSGANASGVAAKQTVAPPTRPVVIPTQVPATAAETARPPAPVSTQYTSKPQSNATVALPGQSVPVGPQVVPVAQKPLKSQRYVCPHQMDLVFALDSSTDVTDEQWAKQKQFMKAVLDSFQISEGGSHAGVVAYSTIPAVDMTLENSNRVEDIGKAIQDLPRDLGNRNLVILLEMSRFEVFTKSGGMRTHVPKALVVSVLGPQNDDTSNAARGLKSFSSQLHSGGIQVIAVGSDKFQESDLGNMVTRPDYAVKVADLASGDEAQKVAKIVCHVAVLNAAAIPGASPVSTRPAPALSRPAIASVLPASHAPMKPVAGKSPAVAQSALKPSLGTLKPLQQSREEYPFKCRPVLYFDFDLVCSDTVYDESGLGNNGQLQGNVITEGGYNGDNGVDLTNGFIQLDGSFKGKPTQAVTLATWIKVKDLSGPNVNEIFSTLAPGTQSSTKKGQYHFEVDQGKVRFFQRNLDKTVYGRTTKKVVEPNTWAHVAGTYDPSTKQTVVYVNGEAMKDYDQMDVQQTNTLNTDWALGAFIGSHLLDNATRRQFRGAMDEFYMFPCALTAKQINSLKDIHALPLNPGPYPGVKREVWRGVKGSTITDMAFSKHYPHNPSEVSIIPSFSSPEFEAEGSGSRISGYFVPPYTGKYSFSLTGDNEAELFLSSDSLQKNKDMVAGVGSLLKRRQLDRSFSQQPIFSLEAGKYYWLEALHKGAKRSTVSVGYSLECPNSPPVTSKNPIAQSSLQYRIPRSCQEVKHMWPGFDDDEYAIQINSSCEPVRVYCHGMKTTSPREYLTLGAGPDRNFASFYRGRLLNYESCSGPTNKQPKLTENHWGTTRFHKIRIDPQTSMIQRDDFTFTDTIGNPVRYGRAGDCFSAASKCKQGKFQVDLTGTGLRVRNDIDWEPWGSPKIPQKLLKYRKTPDGSMVYGECGGSCGGCQPKNEKLYLEPMNCDPGKSLAAVNRGAVPKPDGKQKEPISKTGSHQSPPKAADSTPHVSDQAATKKTTISHKPETKEHVTSFFSSEPGLDESELEVVGHVNRKRSNMKRKRRASSL